MPKELIYSDEPETGPVEHIAVGWARDGGVQIGVQAGPGVKIRIGDNPAEYTEASLWMDLDRDRINKLIRALRRARDAAYGADA